MKKLITILAVAVVLIVGLGAAKNWIAQAAVKGGVKNLTGLDLNMQKLDIGLLGTYLDVRGLKLHNPEGFTDPVMIDLPEVYVDYKAGPLLAGTVHLREVTVDMKELVIVKNKDGEFNLSRLKPEEKAKKEVPAPAPRPADEEAAPGDEGPAPDVRIDRLHLKMGKVVYKDYSAGGSPVVREFPLNLDERHENIRDANVLIALIVGKALMNTAIAQVANVDLTEFAANYGLENLNLNQLGLEGLREFAPDLQGEIGAKVMEFQTKAKEVMRDPEFRKKMDEVQEKAKQFTDQIQTQSGGSGDGSADLAGRANEAVEGLKNLFGDLAGETQQ